MGECRNCGSFTARDTWKCGDCLVAEAQEDAAYAAKEIARSSAEEARKTAMHQQFLSAVTSGNEAEDKLGSLLKSNMLDEDIAVEFMVDIAANYPKYHAMLAKHLLDKGKIDSSFLKQLSTYLWDSSGVRNASHVRIYMDKKALYDFICSDSYLKHFATQLNKYLWAYEEKERLEEERLAEKERLEEKRLAEKEHLEEEDRKLRAIESELRDKRNKRDAGVNAIAIILGMCTSYYLVCTWLGSWASGMFWYAWIIVLGLFASTAIWNKIINRRADRSLPLIIIYLLGMVHFLWVYPVAFIFAKITQFIFAIIIGICGIIIGIIIRIFMHIF